MRQPVYQENEEDRNYPEGDCRLPDEVKTGLN
jgi:hypothetical protein